MTTANLRSLYLTINHHNTVQAMEPPEWWLQYDYAAIVSWREGPEKRVGGTKQVGGCDTITVN